MDSLENTSGGQRPETLTVQEVQQILKLGRNIVQGILGHSSLETTRSARQ